MEDVKCEMLKSKIELNVSKVLCERYYSDRPLIREYFDLANDMLSDIEYVLNNVSESANKILGGEFNPTRRYVGSFNEKGVPLYLILDMIKYQLEARYLKKEDLTDETLSLISRIIDVRNKVAELNYDKMFNPKENLNIHALESINLANGNLSISINEKNNIKYLAVETTKTYEDIDYRNGEYISNGTSYSNDKDMPLYKADYDKLEQIERENTIINYRRFQSITGKYFVDNELPMPSQFFDKLITTDINTEIKYLLFDLSEMLEKNLYSPYYVANNCQTILTKIEQQELLFQKEKELLEQKNKENAIVEARERYRSKNFLWKMVNKKRHPEYQDFDNMNIDEINNLYIGRGK